MAGAATDDLRFRRHLPGDLRWSGGTAGMHQRAAGRLEVVAVQRTSEQSSEARSALRHSAKTGPTGRVPADRLSIPERRTGIEPAAPSLGSTGGGSPGVSTPSQPMVSSRDGVHAGVHGSQVVPADSKKFVPPLSPGSDEDRLLTVREVAKRLSVSTATVYALCERGQLRHIRISNAIRIDVDAVGAFISGQRRG